MKGTEKQIAWANDIIANAKIWFDVVDEFIEKQSAERELNREKLETAETERYINRYTRRIKQAEDRAQMFRDVTAKLKAIIEEGDAAFIIDNRGVIGKPNWFYHETFRSMNDALTFAEQMSEL